MIELTKTNCPYKWESRSLKYLGVRLPASTDSLFEINFVPLLKAIEGDLRKWDKGKFSWFGRAAIVKMVILPRLLYLFHALPISVPVSFFRKLATLQRSFVWANKHPRIQLQYLQLAKADGGMGIPNFQKYYYATHLTRIIDWHCHANQKAWVKIERHWSQIYTHFLPWSPQSSYPKEIKTHPLISTTLNIFHKIASKHIISSCPSPITSLFNNPDFIPGIGNKSFQAPPNNAEGIVLARDGFEKSNSFVPKHEKEMLSITPSKRVELHSDA